MATRTLTQQPSGLYKVNNLQSTDIDKAVYLATNAVASSGGSPFVTVGPAGSNAAFVCSGSPLTGGDQTTIQKAVNAAQASNGGTVYLMAGNYWLTGTVVITSPNVRIIGDGRATCLWGLTDFGDYFRFAPSVAPTSWPGMSGTECRGFRAETLIARTSGAVINAQYTHQARMRDLLFGDTTYSLNGFINAGSSPSPTPVPNLGPFTLLAWVNNFTDATGTEIIFAFGNLIQNVGLSITQGYTGLRTVGSSGHIAVMASVPSSNNVTSISSTYSINDGALHKIAAVFDGTNLSIYDSGTLVYGPTLVTDYFQAPSLSCSIGALANVSSKTFPGTITNVGIWNAALNGATLSNSSAPSTISVANQALFVAAPSTPVTTYLNPLVPVTPTIFPLPLWDGLRLQYQDDCLVEGVAGQVGNNGIYICGSGFYDASFSYNGIIRACQFYGIGTGTGIFGSSGCGGLVIRDVNASGFNNGIYIDNLDPNWTPPANGWGAFGFQGGYFVVLENIYSEGNNTGAVTVNNTLFVYLLPTQYAAFALGSTTETGQIGVLTSNMVYNSGTNKSSATFVGVIQSGQTVTVNGHTASVDGLSSLNSSIQPQVLVLPGNIAASTGNIITVSITGPNPKIFVVPTNDALTPPTSDPHVAGVLWNNAGTPTISAG